MASLGRREIQKELKIDMTPMIDIVFQLIIFFLVVTEMAAKDLADVTLPRAEQSTADDNPPSDRLIINVRKDGELWSNGVKITLKTLGDKIENAVAWHEPDKSTDELKNKGSELEVLIRADIETQYYHVQEVIRLCTEKWVYKLNIATAKK